MPDFLSKEQRSALMSRVRSRDTKIELKMKKALEDSAIEFTYHPKIFGNSDFLIPPKIAVFCDSSFWHGRNWKQLKFKLKEGYWQDHILRNRKRDAFVNKTLRKEGYIVLRFWDREIQDNTKKCIRKILKSISASEENKGR